MPALSPTRISYTISIPIPECSSTIPARLRNTSQHPESSTTPQIIPLSNWYRIRMLGSSRGGTSSTPALIAPASIAETKYKARSTGLFPSLRPTNTKQPEMAKIDSPISCQTRS